MAETVRHWVWETDPKVIDKKCTHCNQPMRFDRASAVTYLLEVYHSYCLLDKLTAYHHENSVSKTDKNGWAWGGSP